MSALDYKHVFRTNYAHKLRFYYSQLKLDIHRGNISSSQRSTEGLTVNFQLCLEILWGPGKLYAASEHLINPMRNTPRLPRILIKRSSEGSIARSSESAWVRRIHCTYNQCDLLSQSFPPLSDTCCITELYHWAFSHVRPGLSFNVFFIKMLMLSKDNKMYLYWTAKYYIAIYCRQPNKSTRTKYNASILCINLISTIFTASPIHCSGFSRQIILDKRWDKNLFLNTFIEKETLNEYWNKSSTLSSLHIQSLNVISIYLYQSSGAIIFIISNLRVVKTLLTVSDLRARS